MQCLWQLLWKDHLCSPESSPRGFWRVEGTLWLTGPFSWDPSSGQWSCLLSSWPHQKKKKPCNSLVWLWKNNGFSHKCYVVYMVNKTLPSVDFLWGGNWWSQLSFLELPLQLNLRNENSESSWTNTGEGLVQWPVFLLDGWLPSRLSRVTWAHAVESRMPAQAPALALSLGDLELVIRQVVIRTWTLFFMATRRPQASQRVGKQARLSDACGHRAGSWQTGASKAKLKISTWVYNTAQHIDH